MPTQPDQDQYRQHLDYHLEHSMDHARQAEAEQVHRADHEAALKRSKRLFALMIVLIGLAVFLLALQAFHMLYYHHMLGR